MLNIRKEKKVKNCLIVKAVDIQYIFRHQHMKYEFQYMISIELNASINEMLCKQHHCKLTQQWLVYYHLFLADND